MTNIIYDSDLTDAEWAIIEPLLPTKTERRGTPRKWSLREILNGLFYQVRTGCQWRMMPRDYPGWSTVKNYYYSYRKNGTLRRMNAALAEMVRLAADRESSPSVGIIDSQSVKTTEKGGLVDTTQAKRL